MDGKFCRDCPRLCKNSSTRTLDRTECYATQLATGCPAIRFSSLARHGIRFYVETTWLSFYTAWTQSGPHDDLVFSKDWRRLIASHTSQDRAPSTEGQADPASTPD